MLPVHNGFPPHGGRSYEVRFESPGVQRRLQRVIGEWSAPEQRLGLLARSPMRYSQRPGQCNLSRPRQRASDVVGGYWRDSSVFLSTRLRKTQTSNTV